MGDKKDAIKFKLDQPVTGKFEFGDFTEPLSGNATGKDGEEFEWFMYKFIDDAGEEKVFFPSKGLQATLLENNPLNGKKFTITKVLAKDADGNTAENDKGQPILAFEVQLPGPEPGQEEVSAEAAGVTPDLSNM